jgi:hypothetical protein
MKLRFRSESERNEFLVLNDLRLERGKIVSLRGLRVGEAISSTVIELTDPRALERNVPSKWWMVNTSYGPMGEGNTVRFVEADTLETEVRRRVARLKRPA